MFTDSAASRSIPSKENALFHELLDYNMLRNSDKPFFTFVFPGQDKLTEVTYFEFGRAAHRVAHYVRPDPFAGKDNEVIAILANIGTLAYHAISMGVLRAGLTVSYLTQALCHDKYSVLDSHSPCLIVIRRQQ
jgi:acyl-CoA synthetase (AMP-forming)/AMP-acid ligase II